MPVFVFLLYGWGWKLFFRLRIPAHLDLTSISSLIVFMIYYVLYVCLLFLISLVYVSKVCMGFVSDRHRFLARISCIVWGGSDRVSFVWLCRWDMLYSFF